MEEQASIKLVRLAQQGHEDSVNRLAAEAEGRLRAYIYRVTLDHDLTQDLSQEALLQMVKSLKSLKKAERFWPWLYRIAQSKIQQYFKTKQRKTAVLESAVYKDFLAHHNGGHQADGLAQLAQKELSKRVMKAMQQIQQHYRAVLSLRCLEQLSYSDIGVAMECNEVKARVLFFRARQALKKQLSQQGLSKGLLVMSLGLFGKLTTPAEATSSANVTVTSASVKVSLTAALIATASTKLGVATITAAAVGLASIGGVAVLSEPPLPPRADVRSLHYTTQLRTSNWGPTSSLSKGAYEQWYGFPDGVGGPVLMRMQRWNPQQEQKLCSWLQDEQANYYYSSDEKKVYIQNYRVFWSSLKVWRLPTDTAEFTDFLSRVEGKTKGMVFARDPQTGLLANSVDNRFVDAPNFRTQYRYNSTGDGQFQYDWPADVPVVDGRDAMHRRGWTYFRVHGRVADTKIEGRGQVPFVCEAHREHPAWMTLKIGDDLELIDCSDGAYLRRTDGTVIAAYKPGSFFKGLARPWMGMHTMNIVRRDAAEKRVWFKTMPASNKKDVVVTLLHDKHRGKTDLVYTIDSENDLIKDIRFDVQNTVVGSLVFSHFQSVTRLGDQYVDPAVPEEPDIPREEGPGVLWLVFLAEGNLGK